MRRRLTATRQRAARLASAHAALLSKQQPRRHWQTLGPHGCHPQAAGRLRPARTHPISRRWIPGSITWPLHGCRSAHAGARDGHAQRAAGSGHLVSSTRRPAMGSGRAPGPAAPAPIAPGSSWAAPQACRPAAWAPARPPRRRARPPLHSSPPRRRPSVQSQTPQRRPPPPARAPRWRPPGAHQTAARPRRRPPPAVQQLGRVAGRPGRSG